MGFSNSAMSSWSSAIIITKHSCNVTQITPQPACFKILRKLASWLSPYFSLLSPGHLAQPCSRINEKEDPGVSDIPWFLLNFVRSVFSRQWLPQWHLNLRSQGPRNLLWQSGRGQKSQHSSEDKIRPYLIFVIFLHWQNFWRIKFTPKNANFSR